MDRSAMAMLTLAATVFTSASLAYAADRDPQLSAGSVGGGHVHVQPSAGDRVRVQPRAKEFEPPNQPDVSSSSARDIDMLYSQLIGQKPLPSSGSSTAHSGRSDAADQKH